MNWFLTSLIGPFLWSISNHLDKILLSKHLKGIGKEALIIYSTFFGIFMVPVAIYFDNNIFNITISSILILILSGCLSAFAIYLYLFALEKDEASIVVPFFQTIPIFGFILGFLLLEETITKSQTVGSIIIIIGAILLSIDTKNFRFKKDISLLMIGSSLSFALYESLFKFVSIDDGFWVSTFWQYLGLLLFGIILLCIRREYRSDLLHLIKIKNWKLISINILNEILTIVGNTFYNLALLMAPIAMIMTINAYQPIFVFIGGLIGSYFIPKIMKEDLRKKSLLHKSLCIILVCIGTLLIYK